MKRIIIIYKKLEKMMTMIREEEGDEGQDFERVKVKTKDKK